MEEATATIVKPGPDPETEETDQISNEELDRFVKTLRLAILRNHDGVITDLQRRFIIRTVNDAIRDREIRLP